MKGDFTRDTFNPRKHFSRVLLQQGRVLIDADWNEHASIFLHHLRTLTADLLGPHAGPQDAIGFEILKPEQGRDFIIGGGHYYVDGLLCENPDGPPKAPPAPLATRPTRKAAAEPTVSTYENQPDHWPAPLADGQYLIYLDVWERLITSAEDPDLREKALGGPDTAARSKIVWQVKATELPPAGSDPSAEEPWRIAFRNLTKTHRGRISASASLPEGAGSPCTIPPASQYRGENQLWRVEVHKGGKLGEATFKVSYDNGSVIFPVVDVTPPKPSADRDEPKKEFAIKVLHLGRDERTTLVEGDWVELVDDAYALQSSETETWNPDGLLLVTKVDAENMVVTVAGTSSVYLREDSKNRILRRWDHRGVELPVPDKGNARGTFLTAEGPFLLADGIHLKWEKSQDSVEHEYRSGDYWLIPAREATGDIEWPEKQFLPPHGIDHHYAPLATVTAQAAAVTVDDSLRTTFQLPRTEPKAAEVKGIGAGAR